MSVLKTKRIPANSLCTSFKQEPSIGKAAKRLFFSSLALNSPQNFWTKIDKYCNKPALPPPLSGRTSKIKTLFCSFPRGRLTNLPESVDFWHRHGIPPSPKSAYMPPPPSPVLQTHALKARPEPMPLDGAVESSRLAKGIHIRTFARSHQHGYDAIANPRLNLRVHGKAEGEEAFLIKESQQYLQ